MDKNHELEPWRRSFREDIVERFKTIPRDGPDLREMSRLAETVAAEVGPLLRQSGYVAEEQPAELYAAYRVCMLFAFAHQTAAEIEQARYERRQVNDQLLGELQGQFTEGPFDAQIYPAMMRHVGLVTYPGTWDALSGMLRLIKGEAW